MASIWHVVTGPATLEYTTCSRTLTHHFILHMMRFNAYKLMIVRSYVLTTLQWLEETLTLRVKIYSLEEVLKIQVGRISTGWQVEAEIVSLIFTSIIAQPQTIKMLPSLMIIQVLSPQLTLLKKEA